MLAVITDNVNMNVTTATATVLNVSDYYPFGMEMKGRTWKDEEGYRYGFNGKEKDDNGEWSDTHYDYGFRIYNPRIAKFLSVDPLTKEFPWLTPYQFASNRPVIAIDLDGLESDDQGGQITEPNIQVKESEVYRVPVAPIVTKATEETVKRTLLPTLLRGAAWFVSIATLVRSDQEDRTKELEKAQDYELDYLEQRLQKEGSLEDCDRNRYVELMAVRKGIYLNKRDFQPITGPTNIKGWNVGDPINNLTSKGKIPSWSTVRQRYWKNRAAEATANEFTDENMNRMKKGLAPQRYNEETGKIESMELHHTPPQREGGRFDIEELWPDEHAAKDSYRRTKKKGT